MAISALQHEALFLMRNILTEVERGIKFILFSSPLTMCVCGLSALGRWYIIGCSVLQRDREVN
jgi:hypothetical protein